MQQNTALGYLLTNLRVMVLASITLVLLEGVRVESGGSRVAVRKCNIRVPAVQLIRIVWEVIVRNDRRDNNVEIIQYVGYANEFNITARYLLISN